MTNRSTDYCVEKEHALAAARLIMRRKLKVPILPFLVFAIIAAAIGLTLGGDGTRGELLSILSWLVLTLAFILGAVQFWVLPRQTRRMYDQTSLLQERLTLDWDPEGYAIKGESARSRIEWTKLYAWDEEGDIFVLMQNEMLYHLVPKSALTDEQEADLRGCLENSGLKRL